MRKAALQGATGNAPGSEAFADLTEAASGTDSAGNTINTVVNTAKDAASGQTSNVTDSISDAVEQGREQLTGGSNDTYGEPIPGYSAEDLQTDLSGSNDDVGPLGGGQGKESGVLTGNDGAAGETGRDAGQAVGDSVVGFVEGVATSGYDAGKNTVEAAGLDGKGPEHAKAVKDTAKKAKDTVKTAAESTTQDGGVIPEGPADAALLTDEAGAAAKQAQDTVNNSVNKAKEIFDPNINAGGLL